MMISAKNFDMFTINDENLLLTTITLLINSDEFFSLWKIKSLLI